MYWIQSLAVFSLSTTIASMFLPITLVNAKLYLWNKGGNTTHVSNYLNYTIPAYTDRRSHNEKLLYPYRGLHFLFLKTLSYEHYLTSTIPLSLSLFYTYVQLASFLGNKKKTTSNLKLIFLQSSSLHPPLPPNKKTSCMKQYMPIHTAIPLIPCL